MTMPIDTTDDKYTELLDYLYAGRNHAQTLKTIRLEFCKLRDIERRQRRAALDLDTQGNDPRRTLAKSTPTLSGGAAAARTSRTDRPHSIVAILKNTP
jgi:hypothetical protein